MIDLACPEPASRSCLRCGRTNRLKGMLVHWPDANSTKATVRLPNGAECETFSMWLYECAWCRGAALRRKNRAAGEPEKKETTR